MRSALFTFVLIGLLSPTLATAQPKARKPGIELAMEGRVKVNPGDTLRWFFTVYDIERGRELRPAIGAKITVLASFHRKAPVAKAETDSRGRASVEFAIPKDLAQSFHAIIQVRSARGVARDFEVSVSPRAQVRLELSTSEDQVFAGTAVHAWGRVLSGQGRPIANYPVVLAANRGGKLLGRKEHLTTDKRGVFHSSLHVPRDESTTPVMVSAQAKKAVTIKRTVRVAAQKTPALVIYARPKNPVVAPNTTTTVEVSVRTPDGRAVPGATLSGLSIPPADLDDKNYVPVTTDARGRATIPWRVNAPAPQQDITGKISAVKEGIGTGTGTASVRVSRVSLITSWAVEGGAMVPGLPARLVVRAFHPDGTPIKNAKAQLSGDGLANRRGLTDERGAVAFETMPSARTNIRRANAACDGPTQRRARVTIAGHSDELCLPVDPDATLRVEAPTTTTPGTSVSIRLTRSAVVRKAPVQLALLARDRDGKWLPVAESIVGAGKNSGVIKVPRDVRGLVWIRARPQVGRKRQEVRGGSAMTWSQLKGKGQSINVLPSNTGAMRVTTAGTAAPSTGFVLALRPPSAARLLARLRTQELDIPPNGAGDSEWRGFLASHTPTDRAVSSVLRDGRRVGLALPADATSQGLLRDPWRTQARFVKGRLGILLTRIEKHVAEKSVSEIEDVAIRSRGGWRFNSEILSVLATEMDGEALSGLDGKILTMSSLSALDKNITYNNVARRITRQRLLTLLVALHKFVRSERLGYEWARRGDPRTWLSGLRDWNDDDGTISIGDEELLDAWGKPFAIRKARGARARFRFLEPIVGYELISAGPDGRFGTRDDVFDPFARVLPRGSLYGEAVAEEALLARLRAVELGRATIDALRTAFDLDSPKWNDADADKTPHGWKFPTIVKRDQNALLARSAVADSVSRGNFAELTPGDSNLSIKLSSTPRQYTVVAGSYRADGSAAFDAAPLRAGAPLLIDAALPPRMRPGEPLTVPIRIIGIGAAQDVVIRPQSAGPIRATVRGPKKFTIQAGKSRTVELELSANSVGRGAIHLRIESAKGQLIRQYRRSIPVIWNGSLRAQHAGAWVRGRSQLSLKRPKDAKPVRASLIVSAPRSLLRDPGFAGVRARYPALFGWASAQSGSPSAKTSAGDLARGPTSHLSMPTLYRAASAVAWSALDEDGPHKAKRQQELSKMGAISAPTPIRERAAVLLALASSAAGHPSKHSSDPIARLVSELRVDGWHAVRTEKNHPTVMARLAAGLLLADAGDVPGRELFNLARATLVSDKHSGKLLPGDDGERDRFVGTVALAIAARQLGENKLATELAHGVSRRMYLAMEDDFESAFWLLAASVYGVFGTDSPKHVDISVNGSQHRLVLKHGVAVLPMRDRRSTVTIRSKSPVLARVEARYVRPIKNTSQNKLSAKVEGELGRSGDTAALEVRVRNRDTKPSKRPVLEVILPSAGELDKSGLRAIRQTHGVLSVEKPDALGLLRIYLAPLDAKYNRVIPIPVRWVGVGTVSGLSTTVYDADKPWQSSSTASRSFRLRKKKQETWK